MTTTFKTVNTFRFYLWPIIFLNCFASSFYCELSLSQCFMIGAIICLLSSYGFAINDICDINIDKINKAGRLENASQEKIKDIFWISIAFIVISLSLAILVGRRAFIFAVLICILLTLYSRFFKAYLFMATTAAAIISLSPIWGPFYIGSVKVGSYQQNLFIGAFLFVFAREIVLDIKDVDGDISGKRQTVATIFGKRVSFILSFVCIIASLAIITINVAYYSNMSNILRPIIAASLCIISYFFIINPLLQSLNSRSGLYKYIILSRRFMLLFPIIMFLG